MGADRGIRGPGCWPGGPALAAAPVSTAVRRLAGQRHALPRAPAATTSDPRLDDTDVVAREPRRRRAVPPTRPAARLVRWYLYGGVASTHRDWAGCAYGAGVVLGVDFRRLSYRARRLCAGCCALSFTFG